MKDKDFSLTKETSDETIDSRARRNYIGEELQEKLVNADALIIPNEGYGDNPDIHYFPEGTEHLVSFLRDHGKGDEYIDICIEDDDYKELAQHADILVIAGVIATKICASLLVSLIAEFIKKRLGSRASDTTVKTSLTVSNKNEGKSIRFNYEGPASTYETVMLGAVREILKEDGPPSQETKLTTTNSDSKVSNGNEQP